MSARPFSGITKKIVERAIEECDDPVDRKGRIMHAHEIGLFTDAEVEDWLRIYAVEAA